MAFVKASEGAAVDRILVHCVHFETFLVLIGIIRRWHEDQLVFIRDELP
jgi:hypothetical protein